MIIHRAYKTELDPNAAQRQKLVQAAGAARWAFNWGLRRKIESYEQTGKSPSAMDLHKELVLLKNIPKEDGGAPWLYEVSKSVAQESLRNLDGAYKNFFHRVKAGGKPGFPKFKSRHRGEMKFNLICNDWKVRSNGIFLPHIGWVKLKEHGYLPIDTHVLGATISERAGRWFVSLRVREEIQDPPRPTGEPVGIDVGVKTLAVISDGTIFENPRALRAAERKLAHAQRSLARKQKGSSNRKKAKAKIAKIHFKVVNIRKDSLHKATTGVIAKRPSAIGIESLNVKGMVKSHSLAKAVSDASMAEFLRQIEYKAAWAGIPVVKADRFFPSTKTCSGCGEKRDMPLSEREYRCEACGLAIDRDLNAALNLRALAAGYAEDACGGDVSPSRTYVLEAAPAKQELSGAQHCALAGKQNET